MSTVSDREELAAVRRGLSDLDDQLALVQLEEDRAELRRAAEICACRLHAREAQLLMVVRAPRRTRG